MNFCAKEKFTKKKPGKDRLKDSKDMDSKKTNVKGSEKNFREVIIEIENDIYIHSLLNPGWEESLSQKKKKK